MTVAIDYPASMDEAQARLTVEPETGRSDGGAATKTGPGLCIMYGYIGMEVGKREGEEGEGQRNTGWNRPAIRAS
jgi:molybdenum-dependent DNA-binding transcriptional regulator ModE